MFGDFKKALVDTYNKIAEEYNIRNGKFFHQTELDFFKSLFDNSKKILEIGCGTGRDAAALVDGGFQYIGIDISSGMLEIARKNVANTTFLEMDFYKLGFVDASFDGFWAAASLLHIPKKDIDMVLLEIRRVLKDRGVGFISVKEKTNLDEGEIHGNKLGGIKRYFSFYDKDEFKSILEKNGFEIIKTSGCVENDELKTVWLYYFVRKV